MDIRVGMAYLDETDILALLTETLTADVEAVFADETGSVGADAAVKRRMLVCLFLCFLKERCRGVV